MKDSLALNKIVAAIIAAALIAMLVGFVGKSLYQPASNVVLENPGYEIVVATDTKPHRKKNRRLGLNPFRHCWHWPILTRGKN